MTALEHRTGTFDTAVRRLATRAEGWVSACRLIFSCALAARFVGLAATRPAMNQAHMTLSMMAMVSVILFSLALIWRWQRGYQIPVSLLAASVIVDVLLCFGALLPNSLFPATDYRGALVNPDLAAMLIVVAASGLRMLPGLATLSAASAMLSGILLVLSDAYLCPMPTQNTWAGAALWIPLWFGASAAALLYAKWTRNLQHETSTQSARVAHLHGGIEMLLHTHHDARGGLTSLMFRLDRMAKEGVFDDRSNELEALKAQLERIKQSVGQIQREAAGHLVVTQPRVPVDVATVAHAVMSFAKDRSPRVQLQADISPNLLPAQVCGGSAGLARVLDNIVINAIEGNGEQGASSILVGVAYAKGNISINVADDGPGIAASRASKPGHTGVGLQACRAIVEDSGGHFSMRSSDAGTCVQIILPAAERSPLTDAEQASV